MKDRNEKNSKYIYKGRKNMKKNILIVVGCAVLLMFSASAYAQGAYFTGNLGYAMMNDAGISFDEVDMEGVSIDITSKSGLGLGLGFGYDFGNSMRIEGEYAYQKNDLDELKMSYAGMSMGMGLDGDTTSSAFLVNGYYDFANTSSITPFISAGIGYAVNDTLTLDAKYRYFATSDLDFDGATVDYSNHNFYVGIRLGF